MMGLRADTPQELIYAPCRRRARGAPFVFPLMMRAMFPRMRRQKVRWGDALLHRCFHRRFMAFRSLFALALLADVASRALVASRRSLPQAAFHSLSLAFQGQRRALLQGDRRHSAWLPVFTLFHYCHFVISRFLASPPANV